MKYTIKTINNNYLDCLNLNGNEAVAEELYGLVSYICNSIESVVRGTKIYKNQLQQLKSSSKCFQNTKSNIAPQNCPVIKTNLEEAIKNAELLDKAIDGSNYNLTYARELNEKILNSTIELVTLIRQNADDVNNSFTNDHKYKYLFFAVAACSIAVTSLISPIWAIAPFVSSFGTYPLIYYIDDIMNNHSAIITSVDTGYLKVDRLLGVLEDNLETLFKDHDNSSHLIGIAQNSSE